MSWENTIKKNEENFNPARLTWVKEIQTLLEKIVDVNEAARQSQGENYSKKDLLQMLESRIDAAENER
tara:strand:+ start:2583 stop:2786 length:204 start_codon:yes stop_codon:yes gene_type:complete